MQQRTSLLLDLLPRDRLHPARLNVMQTTNDLLLPSGVGVWIDRRVQAGDQVPGEFGAFLVREGQCLSQQFLGFLRHTEIIFLGRKRVGFPTNRGAASHSLRKERARNEAAALVVIRTLADKSVRPTLGKIPVLARVCKINSRLPQIQAWNPSRMRALASAGARTLGDRDIISATAASRKSFACFHRQSIIGCLWSGLSILLLESLYFEKRSARLAAGTS